METTELVEPAEPVEPINQKEYLKKYLSGKDKKKKRKKKPAIGDRVKIIDDDIDISHLSSIDEAVDLLNTNEDAPQIVGVIDDRPMHLRIDDYRKSDLWKPLGAQDNATNDRRVDRTLQNNHDSSPPRVKLHIGSSSKHSSDKARRRDESPPRRRDKAVGKSRWSDNVQIHRNYKADSSSPSNSPPRRSRTADGRDSSRSSSQRRRNSRSDDDNSPLQRSGRDSDNSPPRKTNNDNSPPRRSKRSPSSSPHRRRGFDSSPPRRNRRNSDNSPPRQRKKREDDSSPRRRKRNHNSPPRQRNKRNNDSSSPERNDGSSHQGSRKDLDSSPPRQKSKRNEDSSPPRRRNSDSSPPRRQLSQRGSDDISPPRRIMKEYDGKTKDDNRPSGSASFKPPAERKLLPGDKKGKYLIPAKRMAKTLDGKTAGLQSAQELVKENEEFRKREDDLFKNMSSDVSGANAAAIMRDRKTGKIRDLQKEAEEKREKEKQEAENKEKYSRWGRGLKQVEDYRDKLEQDLHEMNKPLARYADDEDLEKYLKEQEREGDPMLDYIRKKKKKKIVESGKPLKPQYEGEFMPNRFGIAPGYRWDGVDRSNGYEKKWFQVQNAKRAQQEEIYKWSTEDM